MYPLLAAHWKTVTCRATLVSRVVYHIHRWLCLANWCKRHQAYNWQC